MSILLQMQPEQSPTGAVAAPQPLLQSPTFDANLESSKSRNANKQLFSPASANTLADHPYARIYTKKSTNRKTRQLWNHVHEKHIFSHDEILNMKAPERRKIYLASLEAHIDDLHAQFAAVNHWPVPVQELDPFYGMNAKVVKSMISGLQQDVFMANLKLLELSRCIKNLDSIPHEQVNARTNPAGSQVGGHLEGCHTPSLTD